MIQVELDKSICCGSKMCVTLAPDAFVLLDSGIAELRTDADKTDYDKLVKAAKSCPTQCITLYRNHEEVHLY